MASFRSLTPLVLLALAGCADYAGGPGPYRAERVPAARVIGRPEACIPLSRIGDTRVRDGRTIDFLSGPGRRGWRNTLPYDCPGLAREEAFSFNTSLSQLTLPAFPSGSLGAGPVHPDRAATPALSRATLHRHPPFVSSAVESRSPRPLDCARASGRSGVQGGVGKLSGARNGRSWWRAVIVLSPFRGEGWERGMGVPVARVPTQLRLATS